jgi:hypothetical protein
MIEREWYKFVKRKGKTLHRKATYGWNDRIGIYAQRSIDTP